MNRCSWKINAFPIGCFRFECFMIIHCFGLDQSIEEKALERVQEFLKYLVTNSVILFGDYRKTRFFIIVFALETIFVDIEHGYLKNWLRQLGLPFRNRKSKNQHSYHKYP